VMVARDRKHPENVTLLDEYGFTWVIPLRRRAARIREIESVLLRRGAPGAGLGWAARAIGSAMEKMVADERPDLPETANFRDAPLTAQALHETMDSVGEAYPLRLDEGASALDWTLDYMRDYPSRGHFHGRVLCAANGTPIAFYAGYLRPTVPGVKRERAESRRKAPSWDGSGTHPQNRPNAKREAPSVDQLCPRRPKSSDGSDRVPRSPARGLV
jgi:hypothetical protein